MTEEAELELPPMSRESAMMPYGEGGLQPRDFSDVVRMCKALADSGLFRAGKPEKALTWQQCFVRIQHGAEIGLSMMQSMWNIYDVYGKPHVQIETAWGLVLRSGDCEDSGEEWSGEDDERGCMFWAKPKGRRRMERRFTVGEAIAAGLMKADGNWDKWTKRMVYQRAKGFVIKDAWPHVLHGLGVAADDEIGPARNVTPGGPIAERRAAPSGPHPLLAQLVSGEARTIEIEPREGREVESEAGSTEGRAPAGGEEYSNSQASTAHDHTGERDRGPASAPTDEYKISSAGIKPGPASDSPPLVIPKPIVQAMAKRVAQLVGAMNLVDSAAKAKRAELHARLESMVVDWLAEGESYVKITQEIMGWRP